jgi:membrane-associated phospholipid phosphatase
MLDTILQLDYFLFDFINQKLSNSFFDFFLKWMRNEFIWTPFYIFIIAFFIYNYGKKSYWLVLFSILTVTCSDAISSHLIKKNVQRLRPCRDVSIEHISVRVKCGSAFSFTSSHATNHFAIASFLSFTLGLYQKKIRLPLFLWAFIICISQVYVGVHFPLDVTCGAILGLGIGYGVATIFNRFYGYLLSDKHLMPNENP